MVQLTVQYFIVEENVEPVVVLYEDLSNLVCQLLRHIVGMDIARVCSV
jgi:hypothetical protein